MVRNYFGNRATQQRIIEFTKQYPLASSQEINKALHVEIFKHFKNMSELYKRVNIPILTGHEKRRLKIQNRIIEYIKNNPTASQWEINSVCKTHVQSEFDGGIRGAYEKAGIRYPEERRKLYGTAKKEIKERARSFEKQIFHLLRQRGKIFPQYKVEAGRLDALFIEIDTIYAVEIKDYQVKTISQKDIQQLNRYINSIPNCNSGLLVTHQKAKRGKNKIYIGKNRISIVAQESLFVATP